MNIGEGLAAAEACNTVGFRLVVIAMG